MFSALGLLKATWALRAADGSMDVTTGLSLNGWWLGGQRETALGRISGRFASFGALRFPEARVVEKHSKRQAVLDV